MAIERLANNARTTVTSGLANLTNPVTFVVASAGGFPTAGNFRLIVEAEILLVTAVAGTSFTATRAQEGTSAASHANGTAVTQVLTAGSIESFIALRGTGSLIDTSGSVSPTLADAALLQMLAGTSGTPSTTNGPSAMYEKTFTLSDTGCQGWVDPNCGSVIRAAAKGSTANAQQTVGIFGFSQNDSAATPGGGSGDALGIYGHGQVSVAPGAGKDKGGIGGFFTARRDVAPSGNSIGLVAAELQIANATSSDCLYDPASAGSTPGGAATGSVCIGAFLTYNDAGFGKKGGVGAVTRAAGGNSWQVGFACSDYGGASITCFDDISAATSALRARGSSYVDVIDLSTATASNSGIKLAAANSGKISWTSMLIDPTIPSVNPVTDNTGALGTDAKRWNSVRAATVKANEYRDSTGTPGLTVVKTVRQSGGLSDCTLTFSAGLLSASTCA